MATSTYNLIASQIVGAGGASSITFSSIPQTYTDLKLIASARETASSIDPTGYITFNGSSSTFSYEWLYGTGSGTGTTSGSNNQLWDDNGSTATANTFGNAEFYITNYTSSNNKSFSFETIQENNATYGSQIIGAGLWSTTSAITSIGLAPSSGTFVQYSSFYLYGIKNS